MLKRGVIVAQSADKEQRVKRVYARLTEREYAELRIQTYAAAMKPSEYIRRRALGRRVVSRLDIRLIAEVQRLRLELRRQGGLLKKLQADGAEGVKIQEAIDGVMECVKKAETLIVRLGDDSEDSGKAAGQQEQL